MGLHVQLDTNWPDDESIIEVGSALDRIHPDQTCGASQ